MIDEELKRAPFAYIRSNGRIFYYRPVAEYVSMLKNVRILLDFHSADSLIHGAITRVEGGFGELLKGIANLINANANFTINYHLWNSKFMNDLNELNKLGVKDVRLAVSDYPDIKNAFPVIKEAVQYCDELGLNVTVDKYPRELGFLLGKVFAGPDQLAVVVNNMCNHKCIFCTEQSNVLIDEKSPERFRNIMNCDSLGIIEPEALKKLADDACSLGIEWIIISGGEPLIYPNIAQILEYIKAKGIKIFLLTNGSLINEEMAKRMVDMRLDVIQLNLSAHNEESYKIQHNIEHAPKLFRNIVKQLKIIKELKEQSASRTPSIEIVFVMTRHLFGRFREMAELCNEVGASAAFFRPLQCYKERQRKLLPSQEQIAEFDRNISEYKKYFSNLGIKETLDELKLALETFSETGEYYKSSYENIPCTVAWAYASVTEHGEITPCCMMSHEIAGNIKEENLPDIWTGERYDDFRRKIRDRAFMRNNKECAICPNYLSNNLPFYKKIKALHLEGFMPKIDSETKKKLKQGIVI